LRAHRPRERTTATIANPAIDVTRNCIEVSDST
jgi:hypothetical protein